jgi:hypothetical protein
MSRAAKAGSMNIVINSGQLYRSLGGYPGSMHGMPACCDAMRSEMKPGDVLLERFSVDVNRNNKGVPRGAQIRFGLL